MNLYLSGSVFEFKHIVYEKHILPENDKLMRKKAENKSDYAACLKVQ
jgi:hypothetical protein